jgi:hypothetical protein
METLGWFGSMRFSHNSCRQNRIIRPATSFAPRVRARGGKTARWAKVIKATGVKPQ